MIEEKDWQASNAHYLSIALAWLRAKLEKRAEQKQEAPAATAPESEPVPPEPKPEPAPPPSKGKRKGAKQAPQSPAAAPSQTPSSAPGKVAQLAAELSAAESKASVPPALIMLAHRLGLSPFEREVLLLCAAMELDTAIASLCARAQADPSRPYPTFALALTLLDAPAWDALSPERPLRYWRLIEINQPAGLPLTSSPLRADERIVSFLKGLNYLDDRLSPLLSPLELPETAELPSSQQQAVESISNSLAQAGEELPLIQLLGVDASSKQLVAAQTARYLRRIAYKLPAAVIPAQAPELETLCRLWQRESRLLPLALYIDGLASEPEATEAGANSAVNRLLSRIAGLIFVDTREALPSLPESSLRVEIAKPTSAEQEQVWAEVLGEAAGGIPASLAAQFNLNVSGIRHIASRVLADKDAPHSSLHDRLWAACQASARPRLDILAQRVEAKATWQDIVLPPAETAVLKQIAAQVAQRAKVHETWGFARRMNRGLGISALFAGDSGTGKTMAAEVIANDLRLNLYRIDLSAVVSKYIGETEKNLRRVFDAAEDGGAILFFDEADALFGKRSEVKDP
jgi:hypothetical protein